MRLASSVIPVDLNDTKKFLTENLRREAAEYFGIRDEKLISRVAEQWFDDQVNYDGRWMVVQDRVAPGARILDMAAGCGTFLLYALHQGWDIVGVEPSAWKREYYRRKVETSGYPVEYLHHFVPAAGEALPFADGTFDFATTYQTLEHVQDLPKCLSELLRVLKKEGVLYVRAPDYDSFFEPHYGVFFLPRMNRAVAARYLRARGRPLSGLQTLTWTTTSEIKRNLRNIDKDIRIETLENYRFERVRNRIFDVLPEFMRYPSVGLLLAILYRSLIRIRRISKFGREENHIELWVTKQS